MRDLDLDEVRFVPTGDPPHRPDPALPSEVRAEMVRRMIAGRPGFVLSRAELDRRGPSYTADTIEAFAAAEPDADLWILLGADQLATFDRWRDPERILARARIAAAARGEADADLVARDAERLAPGRVDLIRMPRVNVSSTDIRRRLRAGEPVSGLLPPGVEPVLRAGSDTGAPATLDRT
jgi:nicotinate-nucleotide adenylyltransferase